MMIQEAVTMNFTIHDCTLCPRACHCDRTRYRGFCGGGDGITAARAGLHFWEEPCISGTAGSGTVFFSGCPLHCCFCQNAVISADYHGKSISTERLSEIFLELQAQGAANINLVTAGHQLPWVLAALDLAKPHLHIPVVYNCGGYDTLESLHALDGYVDIYIPDFKFLYPETAAAFADAPDYPEVAEAAIHEMLRQTGAPVLREGMMQKGCIIRHLVLPGHRHESIALLRHLSEVFGTEGYLLSLMAQYTPMRHCEKYPELNRRITKMEYNSVLAVAQELGFSGFLQEKSSAKEEYTPDFDFSGI